MYTKHLLDVQIMLDGMLINIFLKKIDLNSCQKRERIQQQNVYMWSLTITRIVYFIVIKNKFYYFNFNEVL